INVYRGGVFNSFLMPSHFGSERFGANLERSRVETVRVRRLDQVFGDCTADIEGLRCFLKMDTQGGNLEGLKGGPEVLASIVGIQSELAVKQCYEGMVEFTEALEQYAALGFEVTGMYPVAHDWDQLRVVEFDCVLVRTSAIAAVAHGAAPLKSRSS